MSVDWGCGGRGLCLGVGLWERGLLVVHTSKQTPQRLPLLLLLLPTGQVVDAMEEPLSAGGCLVDYHSCDFFPER